MNSLLKKSPPVKNVKQIHRPLTASKAIQPKTAGPPQRPQPPVLQLKKATPSAPAVYRPQAKSVQAKVNNARDARGRLPVAPSVYKPQTAPKVLQLKVRNEGSAPGTVSKVSRQPVAPPVYRPQHSPNTLQAKKAGAKVGALTKPVAVAPSSRAPQRPPASSGQSLVVQAKRVVAVAPPMRGRSAVIQRALASKKELSAEELADRNMEELIQAEEQQSKKASKNKEQQPKPKAKKKKPPKVDEVAVRQKEGKERKFEARAVEREEERQKELREYAELWRAIELSLPGSAAYVFGLLGKGYATLAAPHRCFLSQYEMQGGLRFENRFGLSKKINLAATIADKYFELYTEDTSDCVVHFHCADNGTVLSFGIKYLAAERLAGDNLVVDPFYLNQARPYVEDITGDNVEARVGVFN